MSLLDDYQQAASQGAIQADQDQQDALLRLQATSDGLVASHAGWRWYASTIQRALGLSQKPVKGVYLWGGVGVGKTYLMDSFFHALPLNDKKRWHFHAFMREIHLGLRAHAGRSNPLIYLARQIRRQTLVICFDELMVHDIADAMLLERLFDALFAQGITVVLTSNIAPDGLYENGLHRARFLPAIELLKRHLTVIHVSGDTDYRLHSTGLGGMCIAPLNKNSDKILNKAFDQLAHHGICKQGVLRIEGRDIATRAYASDVVWFDFNVLCHVPRAQTDYLEIARCFNTVIVSAVPQLLSASSQQITHFIHLIDVLYDHRVTLIFSSEVMIDSMKVPDKYQFAFARTQSRLQEMSTSDYVHTAHRTQLS